MEIKQCAFGHFYDASIHERCPYCGDRADHASEPLIILRQPLGAEVSGDLAEPVAPTEVMAGPVVGWLVCVEGPDRGRSYPLHDENNFVGSGSLMDVNLSKGAGPSPDKPAVVTYDRTARAFWCGHTGGREIVRLNGRPLLSTEALRSGDRIRLGQTELLFVGLCGPDFDWDWAAWE